MFTINKVEQSAYLDDDEECDRQCGEIFLTTKGNIVFHCTLCESKYKGYDDYATHVIANHTTAFDPWVMNEVNDVEAGQFEEMNSLHNEDVEFKHEALEECEISIADLHRKADAMRLLGEGQNTTDHDNKRRKRKTDNTTQFSPGCSKAKTKDTKMFTKPKVDVHMRSLAQSKSFTYGHLSNHNTDSHQQDYKCSKCDKSFHNKTQLKNHKTLHHSKFQTKISKEQTELCDRSCETNSDNLITPIPEHNEAGSSTPVIEGKDTTNQLPNETRPLQKRPVSRCIPSEERKYKCQICNYASNDKSNLKAHVRRHTEEKQVPCPMCFKKFFTQSEVNVHLRCHTHERPFLCNDCGAKFFSNAHLVSHMKRHTNQRDYQCTKCDKSFFDNKQLKEHMTSHSSDRAFACNICPSTFLRQKALVNHMKLHANKREYKCELCLSGFNQKAGLFSHMKTAHKSI